MSVSVSVSVRPWSARAVDALIALFDDVNVDVVRNAVFGETAVPQLAASLSHAELADRCARILFDASVASRARCARVPA